MDSTNSYIVKQNNYIHDTRYDWDKFEDVETKTLVDTTEYVHDSQGRLIETNQSVVNKDNTDHKITEYTYDSKYGVYTETVTDIGAYYDPEGNAINSQKKYTYDILGRVLSCEDNTKGRTTTYQYDTLGTVIKSVNPDGTEILTVPDYTNKNVVETLADGSRAKYVYDSWDNLVEEYIWIPSESKFVLFSKYEYDNNNRNTAKYDYTSADSSKYLCTTYEYDFLGRTVRETTKDENGKIFSDKSINTKIVTYNNSPCEKETTTYYDDNGVVSSHVSEYNDIGGNTVRTEQEYQTGKYYVDNFVYGNYNHLLSSSGDTVETAEYVYDDFGRVVEKKNADGNTVFYTYDTQDRVVEQRNQNGATIKEYYTPHGIKYKSSTLVDTIDVVDYYSNTIFGYDIYGNVVQSKQSINRPKDEEKYSVSKYSYDINNRLILTEDVVDDTHSRYSQYCYDNGGRLLKSFTGLTDPLTITSPNDYTANYDKDFSVVSYEYDDFGNQIKYTDAIGQSEKYEYTFSNLLSKKTLRNGTTYNYSYDSMGRCVKETVGNESVEYTYNGLGQLVSVKDELGTTSYDYDLINRVISESRDDIENKRDYKADYQYSNKGVTDYKLYIKNSETKDFKSVIHETYEYNNLKQLSQLTHSDITSPDEVLTSTYSYGIAGELLNKKVTGTSIEQNVTYKYNKAGQNTEILNIGKLASGVVADYPDETTFSEKYAYDLGGNLTEKISNNKTVKNSSVLNQKQSQTSYTYDSLNRLTKEQITETENNEKTNSWQDTYTFDENDNRLSKVHENGKGTTVTAYKYDSANKLVSEQSDDYRYLYDYDTNGNLVSKLSVNSKGDSQELEKYTYDSFNRLSSVKKGNQTFDYLYDGNGKRIQKISAVSQLQEFWYNDKIVFEGLSKSNESEQNQSYYSYTFDNDLLAVSDNKSSTNLAVVNSHGDTVDLLSAETPYFTEYKYDSFGNQVSNYLPAVNNPYQYNGKYFDFETGFYYLNARYYNPAVGRFMQEDTYHGQIKNASTLNLYNYCGSNPIAYEDGTGHFWETAFDIAGLAWSVYDFAKKPNLWNGLCVAWDVVALVAPCIPGSYVAKGAKLLYKGAKYVVKTSKSSKRANKLIKTLDKAHDTYKAYKKSKNSYKIYESAAESYKRKKQIAKANTEKNNSSPVSAPLSARVLLGLILFLGINILCL